MKLCRLGGTSAIKLLIFQRNLFYDIQNCRISRAAFRKFVRFVRTLTNGHQFDLENIVHSFVKSNKETVCFQGKKIPHSPSPGDKFCRVMNGIDILAYHSVDPGGRRPAFDFAETDSVSDYLSDLEDPANDTVQLSVGSELTSSLDLVWLTKSSAISSYMRGDTERLRDVLGLTHYNENQLLAVVSMPASDVIEIRNPTALDAGVNWIFKSTGRNASWGRTVDLDAAGSPGLPEAVSRPIAVKSTFTVEKKVRLTSSFRQEKYDELASEAQKFMDDIYEVDCPIAAIVP